MLSVANSRVSDGPTPEKQVEQILAVCPILRGQKNNERNPIPPPHRQSSTFSVTLDHSTSHSKAQPLTEENDLIDFGQDGAVQAPSKYSPVEHAPADLRAAQTENGGQQQAELERKLRNTSSIKDDGGPLIDFHDDLKQNLPGNNQKSIMKREDTDTRSLDEFVDAIEG